MDFAKRLNHSDGSKNKQIKIGNITTTCCGWTGNVQNAVIQHSLWLCSEQGPLSETQVLLCNLTAAHSTDKEIDSMRSSDLLKFTQRARKWVFRALWLQSSRLSYYKAKYKNICKFYRHLPAQGKWHMLFMERLILKKEQKTERVNLKATSFSSLFSLRAWHVETFHKCPVLSLW